MENFIITPRNTYLKKTTQALEKHDLLIITGVRRVGKSCFAKYLENVLQKEDPEQSRVIRFNFETIDHVRVTADELIAQIEKEHISSKQKTYILLDEITHVSDWERAVNHFYSARNCKLILLSSIKRVISANLFCIQDNAYDLIHMLPLSLEEFLKFQGFDEISSSPSCAMQKMQYRRFDGRICTIEDIYKYYITYGGLPILKPEYMDRERAWIVTDGSYGAIVTRDIMEIGNECGSSAITDTLLLRAIITIMAKSLGDNISATWIGKQVRQYLGRSVSTKTIENYIRALVNAHMFYVSERYDIKTDRIMQTLAKYYIVDAGFHNYLADIHVDDEARLLENKVFFELLRRGYQVYNGKLGKEEISFVAIKNAETVYIQVTNECNSNKQNQLCTSLRKVPGNHMKLILAFDCSSHVTYEGFVVMNALEFLMGKEIDY